MDDVGVSCIYSRVFVVLIFGAITLIVFIKDIMVVNKGICCVGEKL